MKRKAPWTDYAGNDVYVGDYIVHPNGERGVVVVSPEDHLPDTDKWLVYYGGQIMSRLCLQIGDKGMAVVEGV